jgi:hypothetical protein
VADILEAADEVASLVAAGKSVWDSDRVRRLAVERLLEIVGEAARALSEEARGGFPEVRGATSSGFELFLPTTTARRSGPGLGDRHDRCARAGGAPSGGRGRPVTACPSWSAIISKDLWPLDGSVPRSRSSRRRISSSMTLMVNDLPALTPALPLARAHALTVPSQGFSGVLDG